MSYGVAKEYPLEKEYQKPTGVSPQDVARFREWVNTQPHLPKEYITDLDLICVYHCCGRSMEVAKQVLDLNLTLKTMFTGLFKDRCFDDRVNTAMRTILLHCLVTPSHEGYASYYATFLDSSPKNFVFVDIIRNALMVLDLCQYEEGTRPGIVVMIDLKGMVFGHLGRLDIQTLQQLFYYIQEALLMNLKYIHFLNAPYFMNKLMMILKPFLKKELMDSIFIHAVGSRTLEKFYPMEALPKPEDFTNHRDVIIERLKINTKYFNEENKKRVVESLRPGKPKTVSDIFGGVLGSFKKLEID